MRGAASSASRRRWFVPGGRCGAYARRRADAKVVAALDSNIRTAARAMREMERLKRQCKILAQLVALQCGQLDLAARLIEAMRRRNAAQMQEAIDG